MPVADVTSELGILPETGITEVTLIRLLISVDTQMFHHDTFASKDSFREINKSIVK